MIGTEWVDVAELISWYGEAKNIGPRLRELRRSRKARDGRPEPWTQEDLASAMTNMISAPGPFRGMTKQTIWKIENPDKASANRAVTIDELIGFAKVLNVTVVDLLLPGDHVAQLEAFRAVTRAAEHLNEVRSAWSRYYSSVLAAREQVASSGEDARREIASQWQRERAKHVESFRDQFARQPQGETLERHAYSQPPTPLLAAMEDILGPLELSPWAWANGRHGGVEPADLSTPAVRDLR